MQNELPQYAKWITIDVGRWDCRKKNDLMSSTNKLQRKKKVESVD